MTIRHSSLYQAISLALIGILSGCTGGDFGTTSVSTPLVSPTKPVPTRLLPQSTTKPLTPCTSLP
ncbi:MULTISPECIES: hypothetical protein [Moraxella]|uniref:hypothetical protein n=1 Tax=Moraxella TaxID=475 RepID=UPI0012DC5241|nr:MULTISPECIES: hypothetical protein [Moraxella]MBE9578238.1 hypothetical protein [Moraxella sp. K1664]MBE9588865.1 hypothetical protein [Moraxella sp. K1630]MBE9597077.1 hypothetical protein [Moraxella sp. K2450]MDH9219618.1 hypothetical protein [Moraxella lacunata]MDI4483525.1 hypothetical protein [Moraxella lacunata]